MTKIIFLNGPPFSGKDTSFLLLKEINPKIVRFSFADQLKEMFCKAHGFMHFQEGEYKDKPMPFPYQDKTWRQGVIAFSEDYMKPMYGKAIFGELLLHKMLAIKAHCEAGWTGDTDGLPLVAITDSGFSEEGQVLTKEFGRDNCCVVQLHRPGRTFSGDSRSYLTAEDIGAKFTIYLHNSGSLEFLKSELGVLKKWMDKP